MTLDVLECDMDIQSASGAPLIDATVSFSPRQFARPTGVMVDPRTGLRFGGADPLGYGIAAGS